MSLMKCMNVTETIVKRAQRKKSFNIVQSTNALHIDEVHSLIMIAD